MMAHKRLAASFLAVCLATTVLASAQAGAADPELYFYPKFKWTVESLEMKETQKPVCAVSNQLHNGYTVQIAGTADGLTNFNIDFRQDVFQEGLKYEVQYTVPGLAAKVIPTKAFKKNILVTDLRQDMAFASSLRKSSVVDVSVRGNSFRIYMTGFDAALALYDNCVNGGKTPVASEAQNVVPDVVVAQQESLELKAGQESLAPPPPVVAALEPMPNDNDPSILKGKPAISEKPRYTEELAKKLKEESANYQPEPVLEPASPPIVEEFHSPEPVVTVVRSEKPIVADFTNMDSSDVEPSNGSSSNDAALTQKIAALESQVDTLTSKNAALDDELNSVLMDSKQEKVAVSSENWNLESATMRYNEAERQVMRLGRQLQTYKAQCQKEKDELENMLFDPKLTNQQQLAQLASLEADLDKAKADLYRQQRTYEERIKALEAQLGAQ